MEVILCSKCKKEGKFIIPYFIRNKSTYKIKYQCFKHNILKENDIYNMKLTNELKNQLKNCQIHNEVFCAWCDECEKNLCQICLGKEFKERHNYTLFNNSLIEDFKEEIFTTKIKNLKYYFKEIKLYYSDIIDYEDDIKNLELLIINNENICELFFKENIINFQILKNLKIIYDDNYDKYLSLINNKYSVFSSFIKGKNINEVKVKKIINFPKDVIVQEVLLLNSKLYDDDHDCDANEMKIVVLLASLIIIKIYDINGNLIKSIDLGPNFEINGNNTIAQYKSNILMLFNSYNKRLEFIIFSKDFRNCEFSEPINLQNYFKKEILLENRIMALSTFMNTNKIYKIDKNKIAIFNSYRLYVFKLNNDLLFENYHYYKKENLIKEIEENFPKIEEIIDDEFYKNICYDICPKYSTNIENKGIKGFLFMNFEAYFDTSDKLLLEKLNIFQDKQNIIKSDIRLDYFENKYLLCFPKKEKDFLFNYDKNCFYDNCKNYELNEEEIIKILNKTKISVILKGNEENYHFYTKFNVKKDDKTSLLKSVKNECVFTYSYSNNYILVVIKNSIYQISYNTQQLITITELNEYAKNNDKYFMSKINYYNKELTRIGELFLFSIISKDNSTVFPYAWNFHQLKSIEPFNLPYFRRIIEIQFFETSNDVLKDSLYLNRLLVDLDGITIFN